MLAIIDYGVGNLFSLCSSLQAIGVDSHVTADPRELQQADHLIFPGVGAFGDAAARLRQTGLDYCIKQNVRAGKPLLGICLGMQLLFDEGLEYGRHQGLGLISGKVISLRETIPVTCKIPHIGWNSLTFPADKPKHPLFQAVQSGACVYFVHSYSAVDCADAVIAQTEYGAPLTAAVGKGNVYGCQFHPEKSGQIGLEILRAFCAL